MNRPQPQLLAFVLCEKAIQAVEGGKWSLINTFNAIGLPEFPFTFGPFGIYLCMSDFTGDAMVTTVLRDPDDGVVFAVRAKFPKVPMTVAEITLPYQPVEFKKAGSYSIELLIEEELLALRSIEVRLMSPQPPQG